MSEELIMKNFSFESLTRRIAEAVCKDSLVHLKKRTKEYPKKYGNICFWVEEKDGITTLMYNYHPDDWDLNSILIDLECEDQDYLRQKGFRFNDTL